MINKQSNVYTIVYITVMVIVVGAALALTSMSLKDRQEENAQADKKSQILQAVHIPTTRATVISDFEKYIVDQIVVNDKGEEINGEEAFSIDVAAQAKKPVSERSLPVYVCQLPEAGTKYILPLAGMGLWGAIWGYVAFDDDCTTIYGAFFDHQGETPGLGAEITKPAFTDQFPGRKVFKNGNFYPIEVVKTGQKPLNPDVDYVDGISGGTITSKGVSSMFGNCLSPYRAWLEKRKGGMTTSHIPGTDMAIKVLKPGKESQEPQPVTIRQLTANDVTSKTPTGKRLDIHATVSDTGQALSETETE